MFAWLGVVFFAVAFLLHLTDSTSKFIFDLELLGFIAYGLHFATGYMPWNRGNRGSIAGPGPVV
jgi:hypothetical protein